MARLPFAALALTAALLAGCIAKPGLDAHSASPGALAGLSQPLFDKLLKEPLPVKAPDGKLLDTFVYRPDAPAGTRFPALLQLSPYWSNGASTTSVANQDTAPAGFAHQLIDYFVPRGYAVVLSSVRGTGFSEGCFTIGGPTESKDSLEVVHAITGQEWSDGGVAVLGKSYVGTTANDILTEGDPAVKTVVPISGISDFYKYNFVNGVPINPQGYDFNFYYERDVAMVPPYAEPGMETAHLLAEEATCDHTGTQVGGFQSAATGDKTPYWQARDYNREVDKVKAPVFLVHGLQDWNVKDDHLLPWLDLLQDRVPVKVWLGQWDHDYPNLNHYKADWTRGDWNTTLLRWFDQWLKGVDTGILSEPMVDVQDDQGAWRHEDRWPPARTHEVRFFLAPGKLQDAPGTGASMWRDTGQPLEKPPMAGAAHYALFVSDPMPEDLRISGQGALKLMLNHQAPRGTVAATLWRIAPNGTSERINYGFYDLQHRGGLATSQPVSPMDTFPLDIPLFPQDDVVPAGFQLALTLAGNDSPTCVYDTVMVFECLPAAGYDDPGPLMGPLPSGGVTTVTHGADSVLTLPVVPSIEAFEPPREPWTPSA